MAHRSTTWNYLTGLSLLAAITITLAVGWWLGYRSRSEEVNSLRSEIGRIASQNSESSLRAENADLIKFIDEVYALLRAEGIHIQLDLEVDRNGRLRLKADSAQIIAGLKAKLKEINEK